MEPKKWVKGRGEVLAIEYMIADCMKIMWRHSPGYYRTKNSYCFHQSNNWEGKNNRRERENNN